MQDKYVVVFTKTNWDEAPRIRHQVTNLLIENGHKVIFFQKASQTSFKTKIVKNSANLLLVDYYEPLHHQLKFNSILDWVNNIIVKNSIKNLLKKYEIEFVVNFNYDYYFLKEILFNKKIITIINDDFVAQAKSYRKKHAMYLLKKTCMISNSVLPVSYSLVENLKNYNNNTSLFLPWAENKYVKPAENIHRDTILFYGYVNYRIDFEVIENILKKNLKIRFVGPMDKKVINLVDNLKTKYLNFEYAGTSDIDKLYCDDILFSIIPYKANLKAVQAITINNKSFNLLSKGLPLVYPFLPNLIHVSNGVISVYKNIDDIVKIYDYYKKYFYVVQEEIKSFLSKNYKEERYEYFQ